MQQATRQPAPERIETEEALDEFLTRPRAELVAFIESVRGPLVVLGAGGKMGPTLAVLARRAAERAGHELEVMAVSRFSDARAKDWLEARGVKAIACDLLDREAVRRLPEAENVLYLVGMKFGTTQNPALAWAANTLVPALVAERYAGARIAALSTGNVYPLSSIERGGSVESDALTPLGEYANAAIGRERVFEYFSQRNGTPIALLRLFYAVELRYGVLRDIADRVWAGQPVDLANGHLNCIWQGDANEMVIRSLSLASSPASAFNLTSAEIYPVRALATRLGELLGRPVEFAGEENATSLTANTSKLCAALGKPAVELETMLRWTAAWVRQGGPSLGKPTHFETRDGRF
jgi:nucleoside-diphosphate-sugar epimerase